MILKKTNGTLDKKKSYRKRRFHVKNGKNKKSKK